MPGHRKVRRHTMTRAAALDIGSTSLTLLIADVSAKGEIRRVARHKAMLRLGALLPGGGPIPPAICEQVLHAARVLRVAAERKGAEVLLPVATEAIRRARNGKRLAEAIGEAIEEPVRILTGKEEARLIFRAIQRRLVLDDEVVLGLDLGGGSLELAVGCARTIRTEFTLPLGSVRLQHELVHTDPMRRREVKALRGRVRAELAPHREELLRHAPTRAVATGGTARALARLARGQLEQRKRSRRLGARISRPALDELTALLIDSSHRERLAMRGMTRHRADLLPTGAVVLSALARDLDLRSYTVCDWGLREGVLLEALT
jgi:exopolyphosphatase / guanosine-5'-triphosphate,3'-diphosphate pyrophosphatase